MVIQSALKQQLAHLVKELAWLSEWQWLRNTLLLHTTNLDLIVVDHHTYALCGDGDLMEGVAGEAISLAGHLQLDKLIVLYDSNDISLDGELDMSFSENIQKRFESYGWNYIRVEDGNDVGLLSKAIEEAKQNEGGPTMIEVKTVIGYGSPNKSGKSACTRCTTWRR